ncbi:MAG TPA: hypothetical protein VI542_06565 [Candidatus Tectomicrobia bacterium]
MSMHWARRQFLAHVGVAATAIQTFEYIETCCVFAADAKTTDHPNPEILQMKRG